MRSSGERVAMPLEATEDVVTGRSVQLQGAMGLAAKQGK